MGQLVLISGDAWGGRSRFAQQMAEDLESNAAAYVATAEADVVEPSSTPTKLITWSSSTTGRC